MKTNRRLAIVIASMLSILTLLASLQPQPATAAKAGTEYWRGYRMPDGVWTKGNLSPHKDYVECEWVPYQLMIKSGSKVWQDPDFGFAIGGFADIGWGFWSGHRWDAIYVDMLGAFHYKWDADLSAYPSATPLDDGDSGSAVEFELGFEYGPAEGWHSFAPSILNSPGKINKETQLYDPVPEACDDLGYDHFFRLTPGVNGFPDANEFAAGGHENIVIYFQAHLALDILWSLGQEVELSHLKPELAGTVYLGDDGLYGTADDWTCPHRGSSQYQGSASHFFIQFPGIGEVNIPIPIAEYPPGKIQGHKYVEDDGEWILFDGWEITLTGELELAPSLTVPYNPPPVYTGMGFFVDGKPWPTGYFEFTGLTKGSFNVQEEDRLGLTHVDIKTYGDGTVTGMNIAEGWVSFTLPQKGTQTVDFYNIRAGRPSKTTTELIPNWCEGPMYLGYYITDKVTVRPLEGDFPVPTGTVDLFVEYPAYSGTWSHIGTQALVGHHTEFTYTPLAVGTYRFQAFYNGDSNYEGSESDPEKEVLVVYPAP